MKYILPIILICLSGQLWAQSAFPKLIIPTGNTGRVEILEFGHDSRYLVSGFGTEELILWDILSGKIQNKFNTGFRITEAHFQPNSDWLFASDVSGGLSSWKTKGKALSSFIKAHTLAVNDFSLNESGRLLVSSGMDTTIKVWNTEDLSLQREIDHYSEPFFTVEVSSLANVIILGGDRGNILILNATTYEEEFYSKVTEGKINQMAISPNGDELYLVDGTGNFYQVKLDGMEILRKEKVFANQAYDIKLYGNRVIMSGRDPLEPIKSLSLASSDNSIGIDFSFNRGHANFAFGVLSLGLSFDGYLAVSDPSGEIQVYNLVKGVGVNHLKGYAAPVYSIAHMDNILSYSVPSAIQMFDLSGEKGVRNIDLPSTPVYIDRLSNYFLVLGEDSVLRVVDRSGKEAFSKRVNGQAFYTPPRFSRDGRQLLYRTSPQTMEALDWNSGKLKKIKIDNLSSINPSYSGFIAYSNRNELQFIDYEKYKVRRRIPASDLRNLKVRNDGNFLTGIYDRGAERELRLIDMATAKTIYQLAMPDTLQVDRIANTGQVHQVMTFSRSVGKYNQKEDYSIYHWDLRTGELLHKLKGHTAYVNEIITDRENRAYSAALDGTVMVWDLKSGDQLLKIVPLRKKEWVALRPDGLFDASPFALRKMHFSLNNHIIKLDQIKENFYEPKLVQKVLAFDQEPIFIENSANHYTLYPEIHIDPPNKGDIAFRLEDNGGGIGPVVVKINGKEVLEDARDYRTYDSLTNRFSYSIAGNPYVVPNDLNRLTIEAYNREGFTLKNRQNVIFIPGKEEEKAAATAQPRLYSMFIGISDYRGDKIDLNFAAKDATDFADVVEVAGSSYFGSDRQVVYRMTTDTNNQNLWPTKHNIERVFSEIANDAHPQDVLLVYFAGHGLDLEDDQEFYFMTAEADRPYIAGPEEASEMTLSTSELAGYFKSISAMRQLFVVDACHSGNLANGLFSSGGKIKTEGIRALDQVKDRTGVYVLASSEGEEVSYESSALEQGLLTYSLLFGMKGAGLQEGEYVDVMNMLQFVKQKVPELASDIGQKQIPILQIPADANSFYIGRLSAEDKGNIELNSAKPIVLASNFQNEESLIDEKHFSVYLDEKIKALRKEYDNKFLVVERGGLFNNAYSIYGRYSESDDGTRYRYKIFHNDVEIISGSLLEADMGLAIEKITDQLMGELFPVN